MVTMSLREATARLLAEIRTLPRQERLRLIAHAARELAEEASPQDPTSIIGCMDEQAELLDQITSEAMSNRRSIPLRRSGA